MTVMPGPGPGERASWSDEELEWLDGCPVCGTPDRQSRLHDGLEDVIFGVADGAWSLLSCDRCLCAYLNPRPDRKTIARAYQRYYTHRSVAQRTPDSALSLPRRTRRAFANGYANWRFGTRAKPANRLGILAALLMPPMRARMDRRFRHMPGPGIAAPSVLDIGCGNGGFLHLARSAGWTAHGVDPDPEAVSICNREGLDVRVADLSELEAEQRRFDLLTLSHVLEHLHDPVAALATCFRLLKPGGRLWLETPNVSSFGHRRFGRHWYALDPPRHLVLFNWPSLSHVLAGAGFVGVRKIRTPSDTVTYYPAHWALRNGLEFDPPGPLPWRPWLEARALGVLERFVPGRTEFLTVSAIKPGARA